jgi:hypothetical protein
MVAACSVQELIMKSLITLLAAMTAIAAGSACAQTATLAYTDARPYTDITVPAASGTGAPSYWKGQLSRSDVQAAMQQARTDGTIVTGDASGYPYAMKTSGAQASTQASSSQTLGGPPGDGLTTDGYRFVGGEAGYVYVGHASPAR